MDRRLLLKLMTASAALSACGSREEASGRRVAIVGGGIVGASIAYHLARGGANVTLCERTALAARASRGTFAWVNATWAKQPQTYHQLNQRGVAGWGALQEALSLPIVWGGSLEWFETSERQARLADQIDEQAAWGEPARMVRSPELATLEPNINFQGADSVAFSPNDGALDPVLATQRLAEKAATYGATIKTNCTVESLREQKGGRLILNTSAGDVKADHVVLATGADTDAPLTLGGVDIPQRTTPGVIVITKPHPMLINRVIAAPGVHLHQRRDGRIVIGEQEGPPDNEAHMQRLAGRPTSFPYEAIEKQHANRLLRAAIQFVPEMKNAEIDDIYIGWRPLPVDGHPVIGPSPARPNVYFAIMHSGVSLAPIVGELATQEILTGEIAPALEAYRADRTFDSVKRY